MDDQNPASSKPPDARNWSNRILSASLFGILFFTLFPYWLDLSRAPAGHRSPFLLGRALHFDGFLHTSLNALLFIPFGLALATFPRARQKSWLNSLVLALGAGMVFSYLIELTQIYIPTRDSAWDDVIANTLGSGLGMILGLISSEFILRKLSEWEGESDRWLSMRRIAGIGLAYLGIWIAISIPLQQKTRPTNWSPNSFLSVGNDFRGDLPWNGRVSRLQVWDKALTESQAEALSKDFQAAPELNSRLLGVYDLSHPPPIPNQAGLLPAIVSGRLDGGIESSPLPRHAGGPFLKSESSVPPLTEAVRRSKQVTILLACAPAREKTEEGVLVAISNLAGETDFALKQEDTTLEIVFRNDLASRGSILSLLVKDFFTIQKNRLIIFSYDGAKGSLYIDGKKERTSYFFSPGAALVQKLVRIKTNELIAYAVLYDSLIFLPVGFLIGLAARRVPLSKRIWALELLIAVIVPSVLLEGLLVWVSGRQVSLAQVGLTLALTIAGIAWMNLDSPAQH